MFIGNKEWAVSSVPADDIQYHYEIVVFEVRHVCTQDVGLHFQLDILRNDIGGTGWCVEGNLWMSHWGRNVCNK